MKLSDFSGWLACQHCIQCITRYLYVNYCALKLAMTKNDFLLRYKAFIAFLFMYKCSTHGCIAMYVCMYINTLCVYLYCCRLEVVDLLLQFGAKPGKTDSNNQV